MDVVYVHPDEWSKSRLELLLKTHEGILDDHKSHLGHVGLKDLMNLPYFLSLTLLTIL